MTVLHVNFDPDKKRIEDIFGGTVQLTIPRYQRTYAWSKEKSEEFYSDFIIESEKSEDNLAFIGTIILAIADDGTLEVIDGQQRLITITLFLAALRDVLERTIGTQKALMAADEIHKKIIISSTFGSSYSSDDTNKQKLKVGVEIEGIFNQLIYDKCPDVKYIVTANTAEKRVLDSYSYFFKVLKDTLDRPNLNSDQKLDLAARSLSKINSIEYIDIRVTNKEVAYNLFESHNAKGVALAKTDLIKNYYFGRLNGSDAEKNKKMDEWDSLFDEQSSSNLNMLPDRFFYYFLQSFEGNFPSSRLYKRIKPYMQNHQNFFLKLRKNIAYMIDLKNSNMKDKEINKVLVALNEKLNVNQCFIFLLSLYRNEDYISLSDYKKIFKLIEDFTYIYSGVTKSPGNALEKIYSKHARNLEIEVKKHDLKKMTKIDKDRLSGKLLKDLRADFQELLPAYSVFMESFKELKYTNKTNKSLIRYTFEKIEYHYSDTTISLGDTFTLDHITPQSKNKDGIYQSIGNLTPMSQIRNSGKGAADPASEHYESIENFYSVKKLNEQLKSSGGKFDEKLIEERINYLGEYAYYSAFGSCSTK